MLSYLYSVCDTGPDGDMDARLLTESKRDAYQLAVEIIDHEPHTDATVTAHLVPLELIKTWRASVAGLAAGEPALAELTAEWLVRVAEAEIELAAHETEPPIVTLPDTTSASQLDGRYRILYFAPDQRRQEYWAVGCVVWDDTRAVGAVDPDAFARIRAVDYPDLPEHHDRATAQLVAELVECHPGAGPDDMRHLDGPLPWPRGTYSPYRYFEPGRCLLDEHRTLEHWLGRLMASHVRPPALKDPADD